MFFFLHMEKQAAGAPTDTSDSVVFIYLCVCVSYFHLATHTHYGCSSLLHSSVWTSKTINSQTTAETRRAGNVLIGVMNNNPTAALFSSHKNTHRAFRPTNVHTHFINTTSNNEKPYRSTFKVTKYLKKGRNENIFRHKAATRMKAETRKHNGNQIHTQNLRFTIQVQIKMWR